MQALVRAVRSGEIPARVALVVSNRAEAPGIAWAREQGLDTVVLDERDHADREAHDRAVAQALEARRVELICLAGYMRLLSPWFVKRYPGRILNIHPSLLPAFPGLEAQRQAVEYGVKLSGVTVHFVDEALDHGAIVSQRAVPVLDDDTPESLAARILVAEHSIYPEAVRLVCSGRCLPLEGRRLRKLPEWPEVKP